MRGITSLLSTRLNNPLINTMSFSKSLLPVAEKRVAELEEKIKAGYHHAADVKRYIEAFDEWRWLAILDEAEDAEKPNFLQYFSALIATRAPVLYIHVLRGTLETKYGLTPPKALQRESLVTKFDDSGVVSYVVNK